MSKLPTGGGFLLEATNPQDIFTNEDFSTEHELIAETAYGFIEKNVMPQMDDLEAKKPGLLPGLIREFGDLGLLAADIPEEYGGIESDKITAVIIAEAVGKTGSMSSGEMELIKILLLSLYPKLDIDLSNSPLSKEFMRSKRDLSPSP